MSCLLQSADEEKQSKRLICCTRLCVRSRWGLKSNPVLPILLTAFPGPALGQQMPPIHTLETDGSWEPVLKLTLWRKHSWTPVNLAPGLRDLCQWRIPDFLPGPRCPRCVRGWCCVLQSVLGGSKETLHMLLRASFWLFCRSRWNGIRDGWPCGPPHARAQGSPPSSRPFLALGSLGQALSTKCLAVILWSSSAFLSKGRP